MESGSSDWFDLGAPPTRRFAIYLPSRTKSGSRIELFDEMSDGALELLATMFGGATSYSATGKFKGEHASSQAEEIRMLECFCSAEAWEAHSPTLRRFLHLLAGSLDQESIACSLDGQVVFVRPSEEPSLPTASIEGISLKEILRMAIAKLAT